MSAPLETAQWGRAREGSPWTGLWAVVAKEMADNLTSARVLILELLTVLTAAATVYSASQTMREDAGSGSFLFLKLFTLGRDPLPAFVGFLGLLVPLIAALVGLFNSFRMLRQQDPEPSAAAEGMVLG